LKAGTNPRHIDQGFQSDLLRDLILNPSRKPPSQSAHGALT
jgi:hypothetical protein